MFVIYVYVCDHKTSISDDKDWVDAFSKCGLSETEIDYITHDYDEWYHRGLNTCVAFGDFEDDCDFRNSFCAKGEPPKTKFGNRLDQAKAVFDSIQNGGKHKLCPIIYSGAD